MNRTLPIIIIAQFFCTSVWFAGNAVMANLSIGHHLSADFVFYLTSAVQLGFIIGTLVFALLAIVDRYSPSKVFFWSALLAAIFNALIVFKGINASGILTARVFTGFFLAGIYPVGMKIAADYAEKGLGKSLGFLVGALVVGTALPHFLKAMSLNFAWQYISCATSLLCLVGGTLVFTLVKDGPFRKKIGKIHLSSLGRVFNIPKLKKAAFGYFGHMWELYCFWAFVPIMIGQKLGQKNHYSSLWSFIVITLGAIACFISGMLSIQFGERKIAFIAVAVSGSCCLLFPLFFSYASDILFILYLSVWGFFVVADSPMFSSLVASNAPPEWRGSILTLVNSIGFFITILSIQLVGQLIKFLPFSMVWMILAIGPIFAFFQLFNYSNKLKL